MVGYRGSFAIWSRSEMPTEEQTQYNNTLDLLPNIGGHSKAGQKLTISNRTVFKLLFLLYRLGSPGGTTTFTIRRADGNPGTLLASKLLGNSNDIATSWTQYEVDLDTPTLVNEVARLSVEVTSGWSSNFIGVARQSTDVKGGEQASGYFEATGWDDAGWFDNDAYYIYTYDLIIPPVASETLGKAKGFDFRGRGFRG